MFDHILGNDLLKAYLQQAISNNELAQTLLFSGPDGVGKSLFANAVAKALVGPHATLDIHTYAPEGKSGLYAIDTLREMIAQEHEAPHKGAHKVFILSDVERMQPASANALLKTLEEPTAETTFILMTSRLSEILPTILSRCTQLHFQPLTTEMIATLLQAKAHPVHFAQLAHGSAGHAFELAEHPEFEAQRKLLFELLAKKPSYPELALQLSKLEEQEEDPVKAAKQIDHLLTSLLMWHRDQHLKEIGADPKLLFFPDEPTCPPLPLSQVERSIERARLALQRNMKLSNCLLQVFN